MRRNRMKRTMTMIEKMKKTTMKIVVMKVTVIVMVMTLTKK